MGKIQDNTSLSTTLHIFKHGSGSIILWVCLSLARIGNGIELSTGKILEENLLESAFQQTLVDKVTFQQDNNLKHKAKITLEWLTI